MPGEETPTTPNEEAAAIPSEPVAPLQTLGTDIEKYVASSASAEDREAAKMLKTRVSPAGPTPGIGLPPPPSPNGPSPESLVLPNQQPSTLSAARASAATLVSQEAAATLPKTPAPPMPQLHKPQSAVPALETFQTDVAEFVQKEHVSAVTIAAAEEKQRAARAAPIEVAPAHSAGKVFVVFIGVALLGAALGAVAFVYYSRQALPAYVSPQASFISVDATTPIALSVGNNRSDIMRLLQNGAQNTALAHGLIAQLNPTIATTTGTLSVSAQTFFSVFTPRMPAQLMRTLKPTFLLGVHTLSSNAPFILLNTDSYEGGYAGMLAWEGSMQQDLAPLFPITKQPLVVTPIATTTASSTIATSTAPIAPPITQTIIPTGFMDTVIENHDARVEEDYTGKIQLLWTFLDRNTILIAANPDTVKEIVSRLTHPATVIVPGQ